MDVYGIQIMIMLASKLRNRNLIVLVNFCSLLEIKHQIAQRLVYSKQFLQLYKVPGSNLEIPQRFLCLLK